MKIAVSFLLIIFFTSGTFAQSGVCVDAMDYGAKANGLADDTEAIQKALNAAVKNGGVCFLPTGEYRLNSSVVVPKGVTLKGVSEATPHPYTPTGTVLHIYGGKGNVDATPAITLKWNASIKNVIINYPEQQVPDVIPYPWTIQIDGQMCQVVDVTITNPFMAIDAGTKHNELHFISNVYACPLKVGVYVDQCTDVGRLENVHFNPNFWVRSDLNKTPPDRKFLHPFLLENLVGFKVGRTDWEYVTNCFVIFAKEGFLFDDFGHGMANALITQSGSDIGPVAVQVNKTQSYSGVQFTNCQFMSTVKVGPENEGPVKISNSGFWIVKETLEQVVHEGSSTVTLNGCHFSDWDVSNTGAPCIRASNGRLIVNACEFSRPWTGAIFPNKKAIVAEKDFISGAISGNIFRGDTIFNNSQGQLALSGNIHELHSSNIDITKASLIDFCNMVELNINDVISLLKSQGVEATKEMTIEEIAKAAGMSPTMLFNTLSSHLDKIHF
jgi:hypothetical protein